MLNITSLFSHRLLFKKPLQLRPRGYSHDEGSVHELMGWTRHGLQMPGTVSMAVQFCGVDCLKVFQVHTKTAKQLYDVFN